MLRVRLACDQQPAAWPARRDGADLQLYQVRTKRRSGAERKIKAGGGPQGGRVAPALALPETSSAPGISAKPARGLSRRGNLRYAKSVSFRGDWIKVTVC